MSFVSIVDYGSGNITSVYNAILKILSKETICKKIIVTSKIGNTVRKLRICSSASPLITAVSTADERNEII